jgi:hypothetical protein
MSVMATFTRSHVVRPWGGTIADVARIAAQAHRLVAEALEEDQADIGLKINVKRPGRSDSYETVQEFEQDCTSDVRSIEDVAIYARPPGFPEKVSAVIYLWRTIGVRSQIEGTDQVRVNGIAVALRDELERGRQGGWWLHHYLWVVFVLMSGVGGADVASLAINHGHRRYPTAGWIALAAGGTMLVLAGVVALLVWAIPNCELRLPDEPTRLRRVVGGPARWLVATVVAALIAAVIGLAFK